jgi:hypothetical protein
MRLTIAALALYLAGCAQNPPELPVSHFPIHDSKYLSCLEAQLTKAGHAYSVKPAPSAWGPEIADVATRLPSKREEARLWCEAAFCTVGSRDVSKGAYPDMCAAFQ